MGKQKNHSTESENCQLDAKWLDRFSSAQRQIIESRANRIQVIAAAGSGKTRTVVGLVQKTLHDRQQLAKLEKNSSCKPDILLLSFSRKAVQEIRDRLHGHQVQSVLITTFHSFCYRMLSQLHPYYIKGFRILDEAQEASFYARFFKAHAHLVGGIPFAMLWKDPEGFKRFNPNLYWMTRRTLRKFKAANRLKSYEDMIDDMLCLLEERPDVGRRLRDQFGLVIVDEFQDTDPRQLQFLQLLNPERLLVVGDDYQAIYAFRQATVAPFLNFSKIFPGTEVYKLEENFRSLAPIVRLGNHIIKHSSKQLRKKVRAVRAGQTGGRKWPVFGLGLNAHCEYQLLREMGPHLKSNRIRILTRTNYRRQRWLQAGAADDMVMTIHAAKGLEFPVVLLDILGGWQSAISEALQESQRDEEIRLHYVGSSRAQNLLVVLFEPLDRRNIENWYFKRLYRPEIVLIDLQSLSGTLDREQSFYTKSE